MMKKTPREGTEMYKKQATDLPKYPLLDLKS